MIGFAPVFWWLNCLAVFALQGSGDVVAKISWGVVELDLVEVMDYSYREVYQEDSDLVHREILDSFITLDVKSSRDTLIEVEPMDITSTVYDPVSGKFTNEAITLQDFNQKISGLYRMTDDFLFELLITPVSINDNRVDFKIEGLEIFRMSHHRMMRSVYFNELNEIVNPEAIMDYMKDETVFGIRMHGTFNSNRSVRLDPIIIEVIR